MAQIIDGKALAQKILENLKIKIFQNHKSRPPGLATILVGDNPASKIYINNKQKKAKLIDIESFHYQLDQDTSQDKLLKLIHELNKNTKIDGILVQLPLPKHINSNLIISSLDAKKDVDGFHPVNLGYLLRGDNKIIACTPLGIMHILEKINYALAGKHAVVVGRSIIVGKPIAQLLLQQSATVTICHSKTSNLSKITKQADILICAVGRPNFITQDYIKPGAVIIDVGINKNANNKLVGDVDFESAQNKASYITPVPGGVGPLTIAMLLHNTVQIYLGESCAHPKDTSL